MHNTSLLQCDISTFIFNSHPAFAVQSKLTSIQPGKTKTLSVNCSPLEIGKFQDGIALSIKNNPKVEIIQIACTGIDLDFHLEPKELHFENVVRFRKLKKQVVLYNNSAVLLHWIVICDPEVLKHFVFPAMEGVCKPTSETEIVVQFFTKSFESPPPFKFVINVNSNFF